MTEAIASSSLLVILHGGWANRTRPPVESADAVAMLHRRRNESSPPQVRRKASAT
jgi:hypothetical protein